MGRLVTSITAVLLVLTTPLSHAADINTGDANGAYHTHFCPAVERQLKDAKFDYSCRTSEGSADNLKRVTTDPKALGYSQLDVFALLTPAMGGPETITMIRSDDVRECLFAVTRNPQIQSYGELAAYAPKLKFVLPPRASGSAETFQFLQKIDPDGLGKATKISNVATTDEAIAAALADEEGVTLFVQFPDPDNARFKLIDKLQGHIIPVIDRAILRQEIGGNKVYFAQETAVSTGGWLKTKKSVVTACTPQILFTGNPERIGDATQRQDHRDLIKTLASLKPEQVMLESSMFTRIWRRTRELSATSAIKLMDLSDKARENAKPYIDKAREATQPYLDKAKEGMKDLIEKAKPNQ